MSVLALRIANALINEGIIPTHGCRDVVERTTAAKIDKVLQRPGSLHPANRLKEIYDVGYQHGLEAFAWWRGGVQVVGTMPTPLAKASRNRHGLWNYRPPIQPTDPGGT